MSLEVALEQHPKTFTAKDGRELSLRPLDKSDEAALLQFFRSLPHQELMFSKHKVTEPEVIRTWCTQIDLGHNLPLLAVDKGRIAGVATLHQKLGGWRRHIGRVSVSVLPDFRGSGIAAALIERLLELARASGLKKIEAEFIGKQEGAMKLFAMIGFCEIVRLPDYVQDMQAVTHDYILMGLDLKTDEEYAGMG